MTIKIKLLPEAERPYEKMQMYGEKMLSNAELLAIIIKSGTKESTSVELANKVLSLNNSKNIRAMQDISFEDLRKVKGIGKVKALQIKAVCELAKRMSKPINEIKMQIKSSKDIVNIFMDEFRYEKREIMKVVILNTKNIVLKVVDVSFGGTDFVCVEPKDILVEVIKIGAPKLIVLHNHPSGDSTPSKMDVIATKKLYESAKLLGLQLLDHIVIGDGNFTSIFSEGRIVE